MLGRHFPATSPVPVAITGGLLLPQSPLTAAFRDWLDADFKRARRLAGRVGWGGRGLAAAAVPEADRGGRRAPEAGGGARVGAQHALPLRRRCQRHLRVDQFGIPLT